MELVAIRKQIDNLTAERNVLIERIAELRTDIQMLENGLENERARADKYFDMYENQVDVIRSLEMQLSNGGQDEA